MNFIVKRVLIVVLFSRASLTNVYYLPIACYPIENNDLLYGQSSECDRSKIYQLLYSIMIYASSFLNFKMTTDESFSVVEEGIRSRSD